MPRCNSIDNPSLLIPKTSVLYNSSIHVPNKIIMIVLGVITASARLFMLNSFLSQMCTGIVLQPYLVHSKFQQIVVEKTASKYNTACRLYRQAHVMINTYNYVYKRSTVCVLVFIICEGTLSMYSCISLGKFLSTERRLIFGYTALTMFACVTMIYGTLARIYEDSRNLLSKLNKVGTAQAGRRILVRELRSFAALRILMGDANFVNASTPLVCQQVIIEQTVNLTLVK